MATPRVKNEAKAEVLVKCLRGNSQMISVAKVSNPDYEVVAEHHENLILDVLHITMRPTRELLTAAAK